MTNNDRPLRFALKLDGVASAGLGALALPFSGELGLPAIPLGVFLLAYGAGVFLLGTRPHRTLVKVVVLGNLLWVVGSVLTAELGWFGITALGTWLVLAQAAAVAGFAVLQVLGLKRAAAPLPSTRGPHP
ncbi:hypothetical protein [Umezawaea sp.]|uniref:hypothetical protein n=1 Tax=Umezawaea sp. TaxID=1955258 RepID=UPI002ED366F4